MEALTLRFMAAVPVGATTATDLSLTADIRSVSRKDLPQPPGPVTKTFDLVLIKYSRAKRGSRSYSVSSTPVAVSTAISARSSLLALLNCASNCVCLFDWASLALPLKAWSSSALLKPSVKPSSSSASCISISSLPNVPKLLQIQSISGILGTVPNVKPEP